MIEIWRLKNAGEGIHYPDECKNLLVFTDFVLYMYGDDKVECLSREEGMAARDIEKLHDGEFADWERIS